MKTNNNKTYSIAIAGTTSRTVQVAQTLLNHPDFTIPYIITPQPKHIGRKKTITQNPLHFFAKKNNIPVVLIDKKLDNDVKKMIGQISFADKQSNDQTVNQPDFLMVVDFGYLIPQWLLKISKIAPLNIHPSALPRWRGSSPGQFVLLHGETKSAVTLMVMDDKLDQGPIIHQEFFDVDPDWTQTEYYQHSFDLICGVLATKIQDFAQKILEGECIETAAQVQPLLSPTPVAGRLTKSNGFVKWKDLQAAMNSNKTFATKIEQMTRAFNPWPGVWTLVSTAKGEKRMKILRCNIEESSHKLILDVVQIEGKSVGKWNEVKNVVMGKP